MVELQVTASVQRRKLVRPFIISTGARTHQDILQIRVSDGTRTGRGEAQGIGYLGETPASMLAQVKAVAGDLVPDRDRLRERLPVGGARAALDAALWELDAARSGTTVAGMMGVDPGPIASAFTIVLDTPEAMAAQAAMERWRPLLKVKLGGSPDEEAARLAAVRMSAPDATLVIDANAGWEPDQLEALVPKAAALGYALLEQPLARNAEDDPDARAALSEASRHIPLCADESFQTDADFDRVAGLYQAVNIKLDKCGGLTTALRIRDEARRRGLGVFVGCMLAPTIAIAPAHLLAQDADYADLDGPFWFPDEPARLTEAGLFAPLTASVWGAGEHRAND